MCAQIIDRGRGPEIKGTRVTVYRIMDFLREGSAFEQIAAELDLSGLEVQAALDYISDHKEQVEQEYEKILARSRGSNAPAVEDGCAKSSEELKTRIRMRRERDMRHADHAGYRCDRR